MDAIDQEDKLQGQICRVNDELATLQKQVAVLASERERYIKRLSKLQTERLCPGGECTIEALMSLDWSHVSDPLHATISKWMSKKFKYVSHNGYYPATGQVSIRAIMRRMDPFDIQWEEIRQFIPHIKPCREGDEGLTKNIHIFEYTLSARGCYSVAIGQKYSKLILCGYSYNHVLFESKSAEEVFKYVRKNHYYE